MYVYIWICSFDIYFRHRILQLRYVGSAFLSKRQRSFFNKKASLKARWLRSPSKQVMGFWNQLDWCFNRDLKNRNVPWQIHRNYNKTQCTLIFSKCKLNNILCPTIISFYPSQLKDGRNLMGIFRGNLQPFSAVQLHEASTSAAIGPVSWIRWTKVISWGLVGFPPGLVGKGENDLQMTGFAFYRDF